MQQGGHVNTSRFDYGFINNYLLLPSSEFISTFLPNSHFNLYLLLSNMGNCFLMSESDFKTPGELVSCEHEAVSSYLRDIGRLTIPPREWNRILWQSLKASKPLCGWMWMYSLLEMKRANWPSIKSPKRTKRKRKVIKYASVDPNHHLQVFIQPGWLALRLFNFRLVFTFLHPQAVTEPFHCGNSNTIIQSKLIMSSFLLRIYGAILTLP